MATQAAEHETARELRRRTELEAAAGQAGAARHDAERDAALAKDGRTAAEVQLAAARSATAVSTLPVKPAVSKGWRTGLMPALFAALFGLGAGVWLASSSEAGRLVQNVASERPAPASLRLDTSTDSMAARMERANALEATRVRR